ncbi:heat-shock protein HtpX [Streptomyces rapamycinicus NRRL 5491]|uniref:Heat-shock protein HtpX n=1 Tax=Streptomyces rapamycinicus (strain ATCC 29253 / DSM 41530 / NRRL 5491 / AYB-994) TaxID=1343740 RepID=A0A3L8R4M7_STRRN|nr:heat-shock protein HtpX [Streptomyces rapamycinicus NRRL 5491]
MSSTPAASVLFVCVHNAGRSQMAAGFLAHLAGDRVEVRSAGSLPADQVNPAAVEAMKEVGIDISSQKPKVLTTEAVQASDYVITMGCGDACPIFSGKKYLDWALEDPAGKGVESVRPIRDEIRRPRGPGRCWSWPPRARWWRWGCCCCGRGGRPSGAGTPPAWPGSCSPGSAPWPATRRARR